MPVRNGCEHVFVSSHPPKPPKPTVPRSGRPLSPYRSDIDRACRTHGESPHGYYGGRYRCKRCVAEQVTRRHQKIRATLLEEAGGACAVCGYRRCTFNLHFHHVDPTLKTINMNMGSGKSLATYRQEALKCVLVCANCHGEIEAGIIASPPPQARWIEPRGHPDDQPPEI